MKQFVKLFTFLLFILSTGILKANTIKIGERVNLESKTLNESRSFQVVLPENYHESKVNSYPVIYLLDGDYNLHGVSGMLDSLSNKGQLIPQVILVAIADKGTEKYRKYMTPNGVKSPSGAQGKADEFLAYLTKEIKPYVEGKYRTAKNSIIVGHSMGGLFVLNALLESPNTFEHYVAISPSTWLGDGAIIKKATEKLGKNQHQPISLHLSLADETKMGQYGFINLLDTTSPKNIDWSFKHYPDENHNSVAVLALRNNLKQIFSGWHVNEKELEENNTDQTLNHYQQLLDKFSVKQSIPANVVHILLRQFYRQQKGSEVPEFIRQASKRFPSSQQILITKHSAFAGHYNSKEAGLEILKNQEQEFTHSIEFIKAIASAHEDLNNKKQAKTYYQKALDLAKQRQANQWVMNILNAKLAK